MTPRPPNPGKVVSWSAAIEPPKAEPRTVSWSGQLPPGAKKPPVRKPALKPQPVVDDTPVRRKRKSLLPQAILAVVIFSLPVAGAVVWYLNNQRSEAQQRDDAAQSYRDGRWADAQQQYEQLLRTYPDATTVAKDRFYARLSATRVVVHSDICKTNPEPARLQFVGLLEEYKDSPVISKPEQSDELVKLGQALAGVYRQWIADSLTSRQKLHDIPPAIEQTRMLLATVERFRGPTAPGSERILSELSRLNTEFSVLKKRNESYAEIERIWLNSILSHTTIDMMEERAEAAGMASDPAIEALIQKARHTLRHTMKYQSGYLRVPTRDYLSTDTVVVTGWKPGKPSGIVTVAHVRDVCVALDTGTGQPLWSARSAFTPTHTGTEVLLAFGSTVTAHDLRTGRIRWQRSFHAEVKAAPVAYKRTQTVVPLDDESGTLVFLGDNGDSGSIELREPIHSLSPTFFGVCVAAKSGRVYSLDFGDRERLQCSKVWQTNHVRDSLLLPPLETARTLFIATIHGPGQCTIRQYETSQKNDDLQLKKEVVLRGWISQIQWEDTRAIHIPRQPILTDTGDLAQIFFSNDGLTMTSTPATEPGLHRQAAAVLAGTIWKYQTGFLIEQGSSRKVELPGEPVSPANIAIKRKNVLQPDDVTLPEHIGWTLRHNGHYQYAAFDPKTATIPWKVNLDIRVCPGSMDGVSVGESGRCYYMPLKGPAIPVFNPSR